MTRVGVDLIEIDRVRRSIDRYAGFRDRCFTAAEQAYCESRKNPADIEIAGRPKPSVRLSGRVAAWAERVEAGAIDLSMTHSRELATAVAVVSDP